MATRIQLRSLWRSLPSTAPTAARPAAFARFASSSSSSSSSSSQAPTTTSSPSSPAPKYQRPDLASKDLKSLLSISDLAAFSPDLDIHPSNKHSFPASKSQPFPTTVTYVTNPSQPRPPKQHLQAEPGEDDSIQHLAQITQLSEREIRNLYQFPLVIKRVVKMKSKGKMPSMYALVVVGNGNGLVGVGEGNSEEAPRAIQKAFNQAVRSMDYVNRYDERTVWGTLESNFGTCRIQMRSRPPGFGLRVNPHIHQVAKAAGISDLSAKVFGSLNPTRVIKLAVQMLHGGSVPIDMGEFGKKGYRKNKKGTGMRSADEVGRARGRQAVTL
ncbi:37S ribosomal protein s5 [Pseudohyphozyma bogoriensis]|nr:37S ribosomal protein s5 [Pseudohyphozyma bogoriensis]